MKIVKKRSSAFPRRRWLLLRSEVREEHPHHSLPIPRLRLLHLLYVLLIALAALCSSYDGHFGVVCLGGSNSFSVSVAAEDWRYVPVCAIGRIIKKNEKFRMESNQYI